MATSQSLLVGRHNSLPGSWKRSASLGACISKFKRGWKHNIPSSIQPLSGNRLVILSSIHKNSPPFILASMYRCQIGSSGEHSRHSSNRTVTTGRRRLSKEDFQGFRGDFMGAECEGKVERQLTLIAQCIILSLWCLLGGFDAFTITNWVAEAAPVPTHALELNVQDDVKHNTKFSSPHFLGLANQPVDTGSRFSARELDVSQSQLGYIEDSGARQSNVVLGCPVRSRKAPLSVLLRYPRGFQDNQGPELQIPNSGFLREGVGESLGISYGQIVAARDDTNQRRSMYTKDAWMGMRRLQQYGRLVDSMEPKEKVCLECTRNRRLLEQVWQTVSNDYYDQFGSFSQSQWAGELYRTLSKAGGVLRTKAETYRAVKEMVSNLGDKYSSFLNSEEYRLAIHHPLPSEIKYLAYQYTGVGLELGTRSSNGGFTVVAPLAGSPAEEAGILGGEQLVAVDNTPMESLTRDEAIALLRGPVGSTVELSVSRENSAQPPRIVSLDRRALPLPPLRMRILDSENGQAVAYLRLHYFTHEGTKKMAAAIREGEALGVDGYILDLRNNPGGVFEEAIAMAALWLDCNGCDVTETVRSNAANIEDLVYSVGNLPKDVFLKHPGVLTHAPLAIITNRDSASASEVLTGALHDNHRVHTIGERTFGKGVVQYYFPMDDGSGLKLTVAKYLTPARYDISKQGGLEPDKACSDYPHGELASDKCIQDALGMLSNTNTYSSAPPSAPLPYRWLPLTQHRLWASGSY